MSVEIHTVPPQSEKVRLSDYAVNIFKSLPTKSGVKKALKKGEITRNGVVAHSGDYLLGGEELKLERKLNHRPYNLSYPVVCEDDHMAVINKPAGIPVHSHAHRNIQNTVTHNLVPSTLLHAMDLPRPVHRLDHETSGLLMIAKTYEAMTMLGSALTNNEIKKTYTAVAIGDISESSPITTPLDNKVCRTDFLTKATISSEKYEKLNLLEINLKSGRRNQIRRHFLEIGNPILGDKKFFIEDKISYGNGLYLVANALSLIHPVTEEELNISIPLPKKYSRLFPNSI